MADIEKVKAGLRVCRTGVPCDDCPYFAECPECHPDALVDDTLAVIEQQAQEIASLKTQLAEALAVRGW